MPENSATIALAPGWVASQHRRRSVYWQIFLTYLRRRWLLLLLLFLAMYPAGIVGLLCGPHFGFAIALAFSFMAIIMHLKEQMASSRASLVPEFRARHLLVAGLFVAPMLLIIPAVAMAADLPWFPVAAATLAYSALLAWGVFASRWLFIAGMLLLYSPLVPGCDSLYAGMFAGHLPVLAVAMFVTGIAALVAFIWRMLRFSEESPEYCLSVSFLNLVPPSPGHQQPSISAAAFRRPLAVWLLAPADEKLRRWWGGSFTVRGIAARRRAIEGRQPVFQTLSLIVPVVAMFFFIDRQNLFQSRGASSPFMIAWIPLMLPAALVGSSAFSRWPRLGYEALLPASREQLLASEALLLAREIVRVWLIISVLLLGWIGCFASSLLSSTAFWSGIAGAALLQFLTFAIVLWFLRYRSLLITAVTVALIGSMFPLGLLLAYLHPSLPVLQVALLVLAAVGLAALILRDAARRWMRTDLA